MMSKRIALLAGAVALAGLFFASGLAPAHATTRYGFAYGGDQAARMWQTSQYEPGTCSIQGDYTLAQQHPETNTVDSVVVKVPTAWLGKSITIQWGALQYPPAPVGASLMVRFVHYTGQSGSSCPHQDATLKNPGTFSVPVMSNAELMVVTATAGAVEPWFQV